MLSLDLGSSLRYVKASFQFLSEKGSEKGSTRLTECSPPPPMVLVNSASSQITPFGRRLFLLSHEQ